MSQARRVYRPMIVTVPASAGAHVAGTYEIHLGQPGQPKVYRRVGDGAAKGGGRLIRVAPSDRQRLGAVTHAMQQGLAERKRLDAERAAALEAQKKRASFRIGAFLQRLWYSPHLVDFGDGPKRTARVVLWFWIVFDWFRRGLRNAGFIEIREGEYWRDARWRLHFWKVRQARRQAKETGSDRSESS